MENIFTWTMTIFLLFSEIEIFMINWFYYSYDYRSSWTPLSPITIIDTASKWWLGAKNVTNHASAAFSMPTRLKLTNMYREIFVYVKILSWLSEASWVPLVITALVIGRNRANIRITVNNKRFQRAFFSWFKIKDKELFCLTSGYFANIS